jgi:hypothetical protein
MTNPAKTVPCPWCKAEAGYGCVNPDGSAFKAGIHMARYQARFYAEREEKVS